MAKIFIGSSIQALPLVRELEGWLAQAGHELETWDSDGFYGGDYTLEFLLERAESFDAAVFILSEADRPLDERESARDKVLSEFGLFVGTHGRRRAIICWEGKRRPNDFVGMAYIDVNADKQEAGRRKLERWAAELGSQPRPKIVRHGGDVAEVIKRFPIESYKIKLQRSQLASILEVYLPYEDHMALIETDLVQMLELQGSMQILLVDPASAACGLRRDALALGIDVKAEVIRSLQHLSQLRAQLPEPARERLEVRLYNTLPSMTVYRVDDMVIGGSHYHDTLAIDGPQFRVSTEGSLLGERLAREHQCVWEHPSTRRIDLADLDRALG